MIEIERKFLVDTTKLPGCLIPTRIAQGYLNQDPDRTVRVRLAGEQAFLTVKGKSTDNGLSRFEWEKTIDRVAAEGLMELCSDIIDKSRYHMMHQGKLWEIDVFHGNNEGLVVAEIELTSETESFNLPEWVTKEVTGDVRYYNSSLSVRPYTGWGIDYYKAGMELMHEIYANFSDDDRVWFQTQPPAAMHLGLGMHLRNHCKMWDNVWVPDFIDGVDHSPNHPDAISSRVIRDFQAKVLLNKIYG